MPGPEAHFKEAFETALGHALDRRVLVALLRHARETRYMELHRAVGQPHKQEYRDAVQRLTQHAMVKRRLIRKGEESDRYESHLSLTERGLVIARFFGEGQRADDAPAAYRALIRQVLRGEVEAASTHGSREGATA